ncbi:MAG: hypothetical protein ACRCT1_20165 [Microcoleaceae cyanobacterium]
MPDYEIYNYWNGGSDDLVGSDIKGYIDGFLKYWYPNQPILIGLFLLGCPPGHNEEKDGPPPPPPPPPPSNKRQKRNRKPKKMDNKCCNEIRKELRRISKVLAIESFEKQRILIDEELYNPTLDPEDKKKREIHIIDNYAELSIILMSMIDRHGFDLPIKVQIADSDKLKEGQQEIQLEYNSASAALRGLLELAWEAKSHDAVQNQFLVRLAFMLTRTIKIAASAAESIRFLIEAIGIPFRWEKSRLPLEFNLFRKKKGKGFGNPKKEEEIKKENLEEILPEIMQDSSYDLPVPRLEKDRDDLRMMIAQMLIILSRK